MNYFQYLFSFLTFTKDGKIKFPKRSTFADRSNFIGAYFHKKSSNTKDKKDTSNDKGEFIYVGLIIVLFVVLYFTVGLFTNNKESLIFLPVLITFILIDFWSFKWQNKCPNCGNKSYKCDLDSHSEDIRFYDHYSGNEKFTGKYKSYIPENDVNNGKYKNVIKTVKSDTTHYYKWDCGECGHSKVNENPNFQLSMLIIVGAIGIIISLFF
jgi:hypothetical protein